MENNQQEVIVKEEIKAEVEESKAALINKENLTLEELKNIINEN